MKPPCQDERENPGPAPGRFVLQVFGYREVFWLATGLFGAAGLGSALLARRMGPGKSQT